MKGASITAAWTRRAVLTATERGLDATSLLAEAAIAPELLDDPRGRVPYERHACLFDTLARRLDDPGIGIDVGARANAGRSAVNKMFGNATRKSPPRSAKSMRRRAIATGAAGPPSNPRSSRS